MLLHLFYKWIIYIQNLRNNVTGSVLRILCANRPIGTQKHDRDYSRNKACFTLYIQ